MYRNRRTPSEDNTQTEKQQTQNEKARALMQIKVGNWRISYYAVEVSKRSFLFFHQDIQHKSVQMRSLYNILAFYGFIVMIKLMMIPVKRLLTEAFFVKCGCNLKCTSFVFLLFETLLIPLLPLVMISLRMQRRQLTILAMHKN